MGAKAKRRRMSTFTVKGQDVEVEAVMATIRKRIEEKRKGLYTDTEIREIAEMKKPDLNAHDVENAMRIIEGTARSMGITVEG